MPTPQEDLLAAADAYANATMPKPPGWVLPIDPDPTDRIKALQAALGVPAGGQFGPLTLGAIEKKLGLAKPQIRYGIAVPGGPAATASFEKQLGLIVACNREYQLAPPAKQQLDPSATLAADKAAGRRSLLSVKPEGGVAGWKLPPSPAFLDRWAGWLAAYEADLYGNHEPENDGGHPADFKRWLGELIDGLRSRLGVNPAIRLGACLMAWTAGRNWQDYLPTNLEVLAWDGYGSLTAADKTDRDPQPIFDPCVAINRQLGLPMVIAETGAVAARGLQAVFVTKLLAYAPTVDILTDVAYFSSGQCALDKDGLAAFRQAFA